MRRPAGRAAARVRLDGDAAVPLDETLQFMRLLWVIVHGLQKASKRMSRELGITGPQRLVIRVLGLAPGQSAGTLARVLHLHPSTLTGVLKRLEAQGLITRVAAVEDGRRSVLHLTAKGRRINTVSGGTVEAVVRETLRDVSATDQRCTRAVLTRLAQQMEAAGAGVQRPRRGGAARSR